MSEHTEETWMGLFWKLSLELNCLPSCFVDGNDHVFRQVGELKLQRDELLAALLEAEKALNDIRVCCQHTSWDQTGPAVIKARAAIASVKGGAE